MREAYIRLLDAMQVVERYGGENKAALQDALLLLQPADIEKKRRGRWMQCRDGKTMECSVCGEWVKLGDRTLMGAALDNTYCRGCGAEMVADIVAG